jgi:hypothetical protein
MGLEKDREAHALQTLLVERGLTHLHVIARGTALTLASGPPEDPEPEVRLSAVAKDLWRLDLRHHTGRWDQTPITGSMAELLDAAQGMGRLEDDGWGGP